MGKPHRFIIYVVVNKNNGKLYVGQSRRMNARARLLEHFRHAITYGFNSCPHFYPALRKHGRESFYVFEVQEASSQKELDSLETEWILRLGTLDHGVGYNLSEGGASPIPSQETLARRSASLKGRTKSIEHRRKISEAHKGQPSHFRGKKMSDSRYQKIKESGVWDRGTESFQFLQDVSLSKILELQKEGLNLTQMGKRLGCSRGTIRNRLKEIR